MRFVRHVGMAALLFNTMAARADHATVRIQLPETSVAAVDASKPDASRPCAGIWRSAVLAQITMTSANPVHASHADTPAGRATTSMPAVNASTSIGGPTTKVVSD